MCIRDRFPTPQWAADGERLLYATADAVRQRLIVADLQGQELTELTDYPGRISFSLSPDGARVAYIVTERMARSSSLGPVSYTHLDVYKRQDQH